MTNLQEIWTPIQNYEKLYLVSNKGRIKSLPRLVSNSTGGSWFTKERVLKPRPTVAGYHMIQLYRKNVSASLSIHRLVAQAFIPNPENKKEVNHKNGLKADNRVENLEWCNPSENMKHACANKLNSGPPLKYGKNNNKAKAVIDKSTGKKYDTIKDMLKDLGISRTVADKILAKKHHKYSHLEFAVGK